MNEYKILIFDLDDTLIDNTENVRHAYARMMEAAGEDYTEEGFERWCRIDEKFWRDRQDGLIELPERFRHETGKKSDDFLDWLRAQRVLIYFDHQIDLARAIELNMIFMQALTEAVVAIDGAQEVLAYLSGKYYIIIATNGPKIAAKEKLSKIGCLELVNEVLSADMFGYMKPKAEFFAAIQKLLNDSKKEDYLMIGDSLKSDVGFAMNCGFDSCWFNKNHDKLPEQYKPTMIIEKLDELKKLL